MNSSSAYSRRSARPWQQRDFLDRLDDQPSRRPEPDPRLAVRLNRVAHVSDVLSRVLETLVTTEGSGRP